ncbi:MAG: protein arginine kinase [Candidatus Eisenbacteria bacterium]|jgi:protein arginine kinase|nr:protein arginine kinase [Candidatus Eisenbacteria bacterium]
MISFDDMVTAPSTWLAGDGPHADKVISSRARIARNLSGYCFPHRAKPEDRLRLADTVLPVLQSLPGLRPCHFLRLADVSALDLEILVERHLADSASAAGLVGKATAFRRDERVVVLINAEDHLRISGFAPGFDLWDALRVAKEVESELEYYVEPSYSEQWGYLTSCPTNVGTGLRASLLVHLPGLVLTREVGKVMHGLSQIGLAVRGFRGEGSEVVGNLFQVSNQVTLGKSEEETVETVHQVTAQLLQYEHQAREVLVRDAKAQVEDKIWRALGLLRTARLLTTVEALGLASAVRLGVDLGVIQGVDTSAFNEMIQLAQPAHVQRREGEGLTAEERDAMRAAYVRRRILIE